MNVLVIGGTRFVGRAITEELLERGHAVTLLNRGQSNADLFPEAEKLVGDRDGDLAVLDGRRWDAVIDTCGYVPRVVDISAAKLADATDRYLFISTISVYASMGPVGMAENAPLGTMEDETVEEINGETYGPLKVLCEQVVDKYFGDRATIVRPGLITGPYDPTDRFGYWPYRIDQGGSVLVPGKPERPIQHIDARDLAIFCIDLIEQEQSGKFNATGPEYVQTMGELVDVCKEIGVQDVDIQWVDEQFLFDQEVEPWGELPFWVPALNPDLDGFMRIDVQKGIDHGLKFRPLVETVRDYLVWHKMRENHEWKQTLKPEKEAAVLAAWAER